jgi:glucose/arabinose dehydrogenase
MPLTIQRVTSGLSDPVFVTAPPEDRRRLFILERGDPQRPGRIKILDLASGRVNPTPFLEVPEICTDFNEQGLLGLAFHPRYQDNGFLYVNFTAHPDQDPQRLVTRIRRYRVSATDPDRADPGSATAVLTIPQPAPAEQFANHKCGWLAFGPRDGFLYIGTGDGGPLSGHGPHNNSQNRDVLLGKMLRIDINGDHFPGDADRNYAIPPTNPFADRPGGQEIWAYGLRNPWRNSFDRGTGDLYIADVGQDTWKEINFQRAASKGGENYGWRPKEGKQPTPTLQAALGLPAPDPVPPGVTDPIVQYDHTKGFAVIGGYVYWGEAIPELQGTCFFGDHNGKIWSFRYDRRTDPNPTKRTAELFPNGRLHQLTSFGEDAAGELYITYLGGTVVRIAAAP